MMRATADEHWQMDASGPELYERYLVPAITSHWAEDLLNRVTLRNGGRLIDIACGTGIVARLAAKRVHPGQVVGIDNNRAMLATARAISTEIEWLEGSALELPFPDETFDVTLCQLGLQFFPDRILALKEMMRVLKPAGQAAFSVFSAIENTPGAYAFVQALDKYLGPESSRTKRSEHLAMDCVQVEAWAKQAGFSVTDVATVTKRFTFPSMLDYVRIQLTATPMSGLLMDTNGHERESLIRAIADYAASQLPQSLLADGKLTFPQEAFVVTAVC